MRISCLVWDLLQMLCVDQDAGGWSACPLCVGVMLGTEINVGTAVTVGVGSVGGPVIASLRLSLAVGRVTSSLGGSMPGAPSQR